MVEFYNTVSEAKILIVRRGALFNGHGHGRSVKELRRNAFDEEGQVLRRVGNRGSLLGDDDNHDNDDDVHDVKVGVDEEGQVV